MLWLPMVLIVVLIAAVMLLPMLGQGRSPHLTFRPEQIDVGLDDVKPARGGPSLLAGRPAPHAALADPGQAR
jgi:hypothetical protein